MFYVVTSSFKTWRF